MALFNPFRKKRSCKINLHPKNAGPVSFYKSIHLQEVGLGNNSEICRRGYTNNFMGTRQPGILVHGTPEGKMKFVDGLELYPRVGDFDAVSYISERERILSPVEFYEYLKSRFSLDLASDKTPLHLICCFSGAAGSIYQKSIAQQLADVTQRRIWAYGLHEEVFTRNQLQGLVDIINNKGQILNSEMIEIKPVLIYPQSRRTDVTRNHNRYG